MTRTLLAVLFMPLLAVAAPVPKPAPSMTEVFGEIADPNSECKFKMSKSGALTITVPTTAPATDPWGTWVVPPMVGKEVKGDFTLTVRVAVELPETTARRGAGEWPTILAGVSVVSDGGPLPGATLGARWRLRREVWNGFTQSRSRFPKGGSDTPFRQASEEPIWFRVTRQGDRLEAEVSHDGERWLSHDKAQVQNLPDSLTVGPFAFGCIDQEFSVRFDQYEIKQLPKDEKK